MRFLCLPFASLLSQGLDVLAVSGWSLFLLWVCKPVSALLGDQLSPGRTWVWRVLLSGVSALLGELLSLGGIWVQRAVGLGQFQEQI